MRLLATVLAVSSVSAVVSSVSDYGREGEAMREDLLVRGRSLARQAALALPTLVILQRDWPLLDTLVEDLVRSERVVAFAVVERSDGKTLSAYPPGSISRESDTTLVVSAPILVERGGPQLGTVELGLSLVPAREALRERMNRLLLHSSIGFLLVGAVLWLVLRHFVVRPIRRLDAEAQRLGRGHLESPIGDFGQTELGRLGRTLDEMRQNLRSSHVSLETQNRRLLELDRLKTEFLANVSHEMRTPLTTILGRIEVLQDTGIDAAEREESLAAIHRNGEQLFELVDRLLDVGKLETGKLLIEERPCRPVEVIDKACERLRCKAQDKGLEFKVDHSALAGSLVRTDARRLQKLVGSVVDNAVKFTTKGGIDLTASWQEQAPRLLRIVVTDTGPGMSPDFLANAFAPFRQGDGSLTRVHGGSGLGLYMAQQVARRLGGDVVLTSEPGRGTRVEITVAAPDVPQPPPPPAPTTASKGRVLVVDDARDNQRLLQAVLTRLGMTVELADNGRAAIERVSASEKPRFDLVLMDLQMPEVDGITAIRELRARGFELPIVSLTAHALADDRDRCLAAGATGYETKPISRQRLGEIV
ncbi:MAG TPA: response regulator, partial [Planctomycetota bacterium]|nr:response regulator [Planctomycetota bacterium]